MWYMFYCIVNKAFSMEHEASIKTYAYGSKAVGYAPDLVWPIKILRWVLLISCVLITPELMC